MARAKGSRLRIGYKVESVKGTTPAGNWSTFRRNTESFTGDHGFIESGEVRSDRQNASDIQGNNNVAGGYVSEWSADSHDDSILSALYASSWTTATTGTATIDSVASGNKYTRGTGSFVTDGFVVGMWALVSGVSAANDGWVKVTGVVALELTVSGITLTDITGGGDEVIAGKFAVAGITEYPLSIIKRWEDIDQQVVFAGYLAESMGVSMAPNTPIGLTFDFNGLSEGSVAALSGTVDDAPTTDPMTSFSGVVLLDDVLNVNITNFNFTLSNGHTDGFVIGSRDKVDQFPGRINITGDISFYFEDLSEYTDSVNHTSKDLAMSMNDGTNYYGMTFPRAFYNLPTPAAGDEGPMIMNGPFRGRLDETIDESLIISRSV